MSGKADFTEKLKRLISIRFGDLFKEENMFRSMVLNEDFDEIMDLINLMVFCDLQDSIILKMVVFSKINKGRGKAINKGDILTQMATLMSDKVESPSFG